MCADAALVDAVSHSVLPAVLMEVPSERLLAVSPSAQELLAPGGADVLGQSLESFTLDETSGALPLLMAGRLNGYETPRVLDAAGEPLPVTLWVRRADRSEPPRHVLAILTREQGGLPGLPVVAEAATPPVVGSTGPDLVVDRISSDVTELLGLRADEVLGQPLLRLVSAASAADLLWGLAQATTGGRGVPLQLEFSRKDGSLVLVQMLAVPLHPPASCAFSLLASRPDAGVELTEHDVRSLLDQLASGLDALSTSRRLAHTMQGQRTSLSQLSGRESDIVGRLLAGDRVPAIAKALFLSQSTVRNHLSSVFGKLGVSSQQELVHLLRRQDEGNGAAQEG
jgi:DNA-binding CsgD family transcriptional regulator